MFFDTEANALCNSLDNSLNNSMNLPEGFEITGNELTESDKARLETLMLEKANNTEDFKYEDRHVHVMRTLRSDVLYNDKWGTYGGALAGISTYAYCARMAFPGKKYGTFAGFLVGGLVYDFWTSSNHNLVWAVGARVNRHYGDRFNAMMDLK